MVDGSKTLDLHITCLDGMEIYPSKAIDGCIPFSAFFGPSKNGCEVMWSVLLIKY
jgi:hypothetical protein